MKIRYIIIAGLLLSIATACTDLKENLYDKVEAGNYGKTPDEIATMVGRAYASLRGFSDNDAGGTHCYPASEYVFFLTAISSDECVVPTRVLGDWFDGGQYLQLQHHTWDSKNKVIWSAWKYNYKGIGIINKVMYQISLSSLTDSEKAPIDAELRALRAYYYYNLLDLFGNVPIVTSFLDTELPTNSSRTDVYNFVKSELLAVIDKLPETGYGRMTQNAANTLLARLYLNSKVFINEEHWQDCINACDKVSGQLEGDYYVNFLTENQVSNEIIFSIPYDHKNGTVGNYMASMTFHYDQKYAFSATGNYQWCGNGMCAQPGMYKFFEEKDVRKKSVLIGDQINKATGNVIIMTQSGKPLSYTDTITDINESPQNEGGRLMKYEVKEGETWERDHDLVVMRYAEILMMKAECYVRMGLAANARPLIEQIRNRAGGLETPAVIDLDFINKELKKEFIFESHRRTDNIRFGDYFNPWWEKGTDEPFRAIFPIPFNELSTNSKLVQNPGY